MMEIIIALIILAGVLLFVFFPKNKPQNINKTEESKAIENEEKTPLDIQKEQLVLLKIIEAHTNRTAQNSVFLTWVIIISLVLSFIISLTSTRF